MWMSLSVLVSVSVWLEWLEWLEWFFKFASAESRNGPPLVDSVPAYMKLPSCSHGPTEPTKGLCVWLEICASMQAGQKGFSQEHARTPAHKPDGSEQDFCIIGVHGTPRFCSLFGPASPALGETLPSRRTTWMSTQLFQQQDRTQSYPHRKTAKNFAKQQAGPAGVRQLLQTPF